MKKSLILFACLFFLSFKGLFQSPKDKTTTLSDIDFGKISYNEGEMHQAKLILEIKRAPHLRNHSAMINVQIDKMDEKNLFWQFQPWLLHLQKIIKTPNNHLRINFCAEKIYSQQELTFLWSENFLFHCKRIIAEKLARMDMKNVDLEKVVQAIATDPGYFLTSKHIRALSLFLGKLREPFKTQQKLTLLAFYEKNPSLDIHKPIKKYFSKKDIEEIEQKQFPTDILSQKSKVVIRIKKSLRKIYRTETSGKKRNADILKQLGSIKKDIANLEKETAEKKIFPLMISLANFLSRNHLFNEARSILDHIEPQLELHLDKISDYHFAYLWTYISNHQQADHMKKALKYIEENNLNKLSSLEDESKLLYWMAQVHKANNKKPQAISLFSQVINKVPHSFYAIVALKELQSYSVKHHKSLMSQHFPRENVVIRARYNPTDEFQSELTRLMLWTNLRDKNMMDYEIESIISKFLDDHKVEIDNNKFNNYNSFIQLLTAKFVGENGGHLHAFHIIYQNMATNTITMNQDLLNILYPKEHFDIIKNYNDKIDPLIILSLIRQESAFDNKARSPVGALGLMQLMPATAKRFRRSIASSHLYKEETNIDIGIQYIQKLIKRYEGNLMFTLAAYNAGENRVDKWREHYFDSNDLLINIENIPYDETRKYVKLIFRNLYFYKKLYEPSAKDGPELNKIFNIALGFN